MRILYWHLTPMEVLARPYPVEKLLYWEVRGYFSQDSYFSIYWFKAGIPYDKEPIVGLAFYTFNCNHIENGMLRFLVERFRGEVMRRGNRVFIAYADVRSDNVSLADLATEVADRFKSVCEIWLEFDGLSDEEVKHLYTAKAIPIN